MIEITKIMEVIRKINSHCIEIDNLEARLTNQYSNEKRSIERASAEMIAEMKQKYEEFKATHFISIQEDINDLVELLCKDYKDEWNRTSVDTKEYSRKSYEENERILHELLDKINDCIAKLNSVDFDALVPPIKVEVDGETFITYTGNHQNVTKYDTGAKQRKQINDPRPIANIVSEIFPCCKKAIACIDALIALYDKKFNIAGFNSFVGGSANAWLAEFESKLRATYSKRFDELFVDESIEAIPKKFFVELEEDGKKSDVDIVAGTDTYNRSINIGDIKLLVEDSLKHLGYIADSPILDRYLEMGHLSAPLVLDLKKCGNIMLNIDEENYSEKTINFVNQLIIQFLLSFPANRINFCLIDIDNKMEFSQFKSLTKINNGILLNGIIRDDRQLDDTIKDMEQKMYKVNDDILSYNNVEDIYEYNERFKANPQNVHLFVLSNYPSGMRDDTAKRVLKLIQAGNKSGIFTIIINNKACSLGSMYKTAEHQHFIENVAKSALVINKIGNTFQLELDVENHFEPKTDIRISQLGQIIETLKDHATQLSKITVPLDQMFEDTEAQAKSPKGIPPSAEVLDIPIGARGGEVQSLLLKTTGDGSAHAVAIGGTGSGKSNLLHAIIMSACYKYSPEELNIYLLDLKEGVEFKYYETHRLPHIKLLGVDLKEDINSALAILKNLQIEISRRGAIFKECGVSQIDKYVAKGYKMPRILVIIDEIQELFEADEKVGQEAISYLSELFKQGRAFGINILWASQNIPNVPGLRDKVLSQIGNRISLRLNEPDDAINIKIDPKVVRNLNRPEKGLGVINDIRYGNDSVEFRVAYAQEAEDRVDYSNKIVEKWRRVTESTNQAPMFIVGGNEDPSPIEGETLYNSVPSAESIVTNTESVYKLQLGQDYVTGRPFDINLKLDIDKMNVLITGVDIEILRDMMGYSLLSLVTNRALDADCVREGTKIYYTNGEMINPRNSGDLFNVIRNDFEGIVEPASSVEKLKSSIKDLYKLYKERVIELDTLETAKTYTPHFMVIHSMQRYTDLFNENPSLRLKDDAVDAPSSASSAPAVGNPAAALAMFAGASSAPSSAPTRSSKMPDSILFSEAFKELLDRGGHVGIHFIISIDNPFAIGSIKKELGDSMFKILVKGVNSNVVSQLLGDYKAANSLGNPKVALVATADDRTKVRVYRYSEENDSTWYKTLCENYKKLGG
ncbi:MAG: DNA translocase FtsK [Clostridia bacterium]|nr:DNA translocase FtsK [Clostridia bacterium]